MNRLKQILRQWLGIVDAPKVLPVKSQKNDNVLQKEDEKLLREIGMMRGRFVTMEADYDNTLHVMMELQQKFDVLAGAMGVVIVPDYVNKPPEPTIASISKDGLLGDAKQYINAVMVADKIIGLNYDLMRQQAALFATLQKKSPLNERNQTKSTS